MILVVSSLIYCGGCWRFWGKICPNGTIMYTAICKSIYLIAYVYSVQGSHGISLAMSVALSRRTEVSSKESSTAVKQPIIESCRSAGTQRTQCSVSPDRPKLRQHRRSICRSLNPSKRERE